MPLPITTGATYVPVLQALPILPVASFPGSHTKSLGMRLLTALPTTVCITVAVLLVMMS